MRQNNQDWMNSKKFVGQTYDAQIKDNNPDDGQNPIAAVQPGMPYVVIDGVKAEAFDEGEEVEIEITGASPNGRTLFAQLLQRYDTNEPAPSPAQSESDDRVEEQEWGGMGRPGPDPDETDAPATSDEPASDDDAGAVVDQEPEPKLAPDPEPEPDDGTRVRLMIAGTEFTSEDLGSTKRAESLAATIENSIDMVSEVSIDE